MNSVSKRLAAAFLAASLFSAAAQAQQYLSVLGGATPFGTAVGQTGGFNGSFQPILPLYHLGGRGEAGVDLVWKFQPNWQAYKQFAGATPYLSIDPYPSNNISTGSSPTPGTFGLGSAGGVYARTGAGYTYCSSGYYAGMSATSSSVTHLVFVTGSGAEIDLQDQATSGAAYTVPNPCSGYWATADAGRGKVFASQNNSTLQFVSDTNVLETNAMNGTTRGGALVSGYLRFPNGTVYRIDNSTVTWIKDRNGNMVTFTYVSGGQNNTYLDWFLSVLAPTQIVDSDGRTVTINYSDSTCGGCTTITYAGGGAQPRVITVNTAALGTQLTLRSGYSAETIGGLFPNTGQPTSYNYMPTVAASISFPDSSQYSFQYNSCGELAQVTLPTGGVLQFDYGDSSNNINGNGFVGSAADNNPAMIYRRLLTRREYANGGSNLTSQTNFTVSSGSGITTETDQVLDPTNNNKVARIRTV
jgi:hypothetical protein